MPMRTAPRTPLRTRALHPAPHPSASPSPSPHPDPDPSASLFLGPAPRRSPRSRGAARGLAALGGSAALALLLAACGSSGGDGSGSSSMPGMHHDGVAHSSAAATPSGRSASDMPSMPGMAGMPGMEPSAGGDGLADNRDGYRLVPVAVSATPSAAHAPADATPSRTPASHAPASGATPSRAPAGVPLRYRFRITAPGGAPLTDFAVEQTKRLHFYAIRSDLTGFQHVHPVMAADGTWTAGLAALRPGCWRLFTTFTPGAGPGRGTGFVLSHPLDATGGASGGAPGGAPGGDAAVPLPAPAGSVGVDGYTVALTGPAPTAGSAHPLTVRITRGGRPYRNLQPYLDSYAHLTAFHAGDQAFAHLHPTTPVVAGHGGGPDLAFHAQLPAAGDWRLFLQFEAGGSLHTAALTLRVG